MHYNKNALILEWNYKKGYNVEFEQKVKTVTTSTTLRCFYEIVRQKNKDRTEDKPHAKECLVNIQSAPLPGI